MYLVLPDEDVTVDELLQDKELEEFYMSEENWSNYAYAQVNMAMPEFDITSDLDLKDGLCELGIKDIFDERTADFSPMLANEDDICLSEISHSSRFVVNEEGCNAGACIKIGEGGLGGGDFKTVDFVLNRPFLFVITGVDGMPLFIGVVNQPA